MDTQHVVIHLRFAPDGTVAEISERPAPLAPQAWFDFLSDRAGTAYQPLAGGRGVFRLNKADVEALKAAAVPGAA